MKNKVLKVMICGLCLISFVGCTKKENDNNKNDNKNDNKNVTENKEKVDFINDDKSYYVSIDGKKYYAGDAISDLSKAGYQLRERERNEEIPANKYMIGAGYMQNNAEKTAFSVTPFNTKNSTIKITEAVIGGISVSDSYVRSDERISDFEVYGGIKLGSSMEEVKSAFGEPTDITETTSSKVFRYESSEVYRNYKITFNEEEEVSSISWQNLVFNK